MNLPKWFLYAVTAALWVIAISAALGSRNGRYEYVGNSLLDTRTGIVCNLTLDLGACSTYEREITAWRERTRMQQAAQDSAPRAP